MNRKNERDFIESFTELMYTIHSIAKEQGFWPNGERNTGEAIALIHSEVSEALESNRSGDPPDPVLQEFNNTTVELADAIIRIMDLAAGNCWPLGAAIIAKVKCNKKRGFKHERLF